MTFEDVLRKMSSNPDEEDQKIKEFEKFNENNAKEAIEVIKNHQDYDAVIVGNVKNGVVHQIAFGNPVSILFLTKNMADENEKNIDSLPDDIKTALALQSLVSLFGADNK